MSEEYRFASQRPYSDLGANHLLIFYRVISVTRWTTKKRVESSNPDSFHAL
ncbi:hypothetical protein JIN85_06515 [Luteolibacter pohnpeiensis]|uniref:Uncharacterized protein n=1 Tax=Luteolibacter pohnpeiensis TaxID=454153 RepID=A0A934S6B2_9BACT|nr:hypothetical protein [Luteolibacter pohnpeiensis]MBK1882060.1 hypothetical protein [Luteolibacter pohnpeiensis]